MLFLEEAGEGRGRVLLLVEGEEPHLVLVAEGVHRLGVVLGFYFISTYHLIAQEASPAIDYRTNLKMGQKQCC